MRRGWFDVRPPGGGIAFYVGFMIVIAAAMMVLGITGELDDPVLEWVASGMFVVGVGLWLKHSWARWVAFTFFSLVTIGTVVHLFNHGISPRSIIRLLIVLSTLYALWEWDVWPPEPYDYLADNSDDEQDGEEYLDDDSFDDEQDEEEELAAEGVPERQSFWSTRS